MLEYLKKYSSKHTNLIPYHAIAIHYPKFPPSQIDSILNNLLDDGIIQIVHDKKKRFIEVQ